MAGQAFRWPPSEPADVPAPAKPPQSTNETRPSLLHELSEMWLAPTAPKLAQRMIENGWAPDELGAWCDRCAQSVGPNEENEFGCSACRGSRPHWERAVRLGRYDGALRDWVHEIKFTRFRSLGVDLGRQLGAQLKRAGLPGSNVVVCPAPTSWRRRVRRGVDHSGALASGVAAELDVPVRRLLARAHRAPQQGLVGSERRRNLRRAFRRRRGADVSGKVIVLVDDVLTTGATARGAARALRQGLRGDERPSAVWLAVASVADPPGRGDSQTSGEQAVALSS